MNRLVRCAALVAIAPLIACGADVEAPPTGGAPARATSPAITPSPAPVRADSTKPTLRRISPAAIRAFNEAWTPPPAALVAPTRGARMARNDHLGATAPVFVGRASPNAVAPGRQRVLALDESGYPAILKDAATAAVAALVTAIPTSGVIAAALGIVNDLLSNASSSATQQQFSALVAQINQVNADLTWVITESDREAIYGNMVGDLRTVQDVITLNQVPLPADSFTAGDAQNEVAQAEQPIHYLRAFLEAATNGAYQQTGVLAGPGIWKDIINDRAPVSADGTVYDWRLGVPWLMTLVGMRMPVLAVEDPNFAQDGAFAGELEEYGQQLNNHAWQMRNGVRCGFQEFAAAVDSDGVVTAVEYDAACADINTGVNEVFVLPPVDTSACDASDQACIDQAVQGWMQTTVTPLENSAYNDIVGAMPLPQIQSMIDYLYNPGQTDGS